MKPLDDGYRVLVSRCLRKQSRRLAGHIKLVGVEDQIEVVHQARVAARRLMTALNAFSRHLPRKKASRWRKDVRSALKRLGAARDRDVQIGYLRKALEQTTDRACRPGIRRLLVRACQQRKSLQPKVLKAARRLRKSGTLKAIRRRAKSTLAKLPREGEPIQTPAVFAARQRILKALDRAIAYESCLYDSAAVAQHHEMRIVTKKLRYTMELFSPAYNGDLAKPLAAAKELQDMLGDLHDCDLWLELLADSLEDERKRAKEYFGRSAPVKRLEAGIESLLDARREDRERIFAELGEYWRTLSKEGVWQSLTALLNERFARAEADAAQSAKKATKAAKKARLAHRQAEAKARAAEATVHEAESYSSGTAEPPTVAADADAPQPDAKPTEPENAPAGQYQTECQEPAAPIPAQEDDRPSCPDGGLANP